MIEHLLQKLPIILITAVVAFWFLVLCSGFFRLIRISMNWVIWIVGFLLFIASGWFSIVVLIQSQSLKMLSPLVDQSDMLGFASFLILVYSLSQWTMRRWYLLIKKHGWSFLVTSSRSILLFLRKQHQFFGWITLATATAHLLYFVPLLLLQPHQATHRQQMLLTGALAWAVLVCLVGLGLWVERTIKEKHLSKKVRLVHFATAFIFVALVMLHVGIA